MAGNFYTVEQVAEKLGISVEEIQQYVQDGRLREFRDGEKVLFKSGEVDSLVSDTGNIENIEALSDEIGIELEAADGSTGSGIEGLMAEIESEDSEVELTSDETGEISLAPDILAGSSEMEISQDDTSTGIEGVNVLDESDAEFSLAEDTLGETKAVSPKEVERLDEDVNLDSFGSGSGLLDLSLQADDTSLGAVLDDIYPTEGEQAVGEDEVTADTEQILAEVEPDMSEAIEAPAAVSAVYVEPEANAQSNMLGITLFVPLAFVIYAAVVAIGGMRGIEPALFGLVQNTIWFIVIGAGVLVLILAGLSFALGGKSAKPKQDVYQKEEPAAKAEE